MSQFDFADPDMANSRRDDDDRAAAGAVLHEQPDGGRRRTEGRHPAGVRERVERRGSGEGDLRALYQRAPRPEEVQFAMEFLQRRPARDPVSTVTSAESEGGGKDRPAPGAERRARLEAEKKAREQAMLAQQQKAAAPAAAARSATKESASTAAR
jgi:hypothetical protein